MGIRQVLVVLFIATAVLIPSRGGQAEATTELTTGQAEARFVALINSTRNSRGLAPLSLDGELVGQARAWSRTMAADGNLRHAGDLSVGISANWELLGENVGTHDVIDIDRLYQAFVASPSHLANLVEPSFDRVGVGVAYDDQGRIWTTHRFMAVRGVPAAPPPTAAPTTAPPTTVAPTTAPPTTARPAPTTAPTTTRPAPTTARATVAPTTTLPAPTTARPTTTARRPAATAARPAVSSTPTTNRPASAAAAAAAAAAVAATPPTTLSPTPSAAAPSSATPSSATPSAVGPNAAATAAAAPPTSDAIGPVGPATPATTETVTSPFFVRVEAGVDALVAPTAPSPVAGIDAAPTGHNRAPSTVRPLRTGVPAFYLYLFHAADDTPTAEPTRLDAVGVLSLLDQLN